MQSHRTALISNGPIAHPQLLKEEILTHDLVVAVDGGLRYCKELAITPHLIVGDFDSVDPALLKEFSQVEKRSFSPSKDLSDLEIALQLVHQRSDQMTLFGATGGRVDHTLVNLMLLTRYHQKLSMRTETEHLWVIDKVYQGSCFPGQVVSLLPLSGPVKGVTSQGLRWELSDALLDRTFFSLSNECLESRFQVSVQEGDLLISQVTSASGSHTAP
jgi:thiamine pyrophosphokinase